MQAARIKHGGSKDRLNTIWRGMRQRCNNHNLPKFKYWGGKGITFHKEWNDYETFKRWALNSGYNDTLTIDRINSDLGYYPENCRWVTVSQNTIHALNKRYGRNAS